MTTLDIDLDYKEKSLQVPCITMSDGSYGLELYSYEDNELPTVSVVTLTYNRAYIFEIAVRNWKRFVYPKNKIEWIILDDSPNQDVKKLLPVDNRIKYIHLSTKIENIGEKRNKIVEYANNSVIVHMDDDDYYYPDSVINRVSVLLHYNMKCVGSESLNCINLLDNTSFVSGGGIVKYKNGDKTLICAEASLAYYKTFWDTQKFSNDSKHEEIVHFLYNRTDEFINLYGSFVMLAITHSKNMSHRVLENSINQYDFFKTLDTATVKFLEKMQTNIYMQMNSNKKALEFYKKFKDKGSETIIKNINKLETEIQKSMVIVEMRKNNRTIHTAENKTVNILYFPSIYNKDISLLDINFLNEYELQMFKLAEVLISLGFKVWLYMNTDLQILHNKINVRPWWKWNQSNAIFYTFVFREHGIMQFPINTKKLYYITVDYVKSYPDNIFENCDGILVDYINLKYEINTITNYPLDKIKIFPFFHLGSPENIPTNNNVIIYCYLNYETLKNIVNNKDKVYLIEKYNRDCKKYSQEFDNVEVIQDLDEVDATYIYKNLLNSASFHFFIYKGKKLTSSDGKLDYSSLVYNNVYTDNSIAIDVLKEVLDI